MGLKIVGVKNAAKKCQAPSKHEEKAKWKMESLIETPIYQIPKSFYHQNMKTNEVFNTKIFTPKKFTGKSRILTKFNPPKF